MLAGLTFCRPSQPPELMADSGDGRSVAGVAVAGVAKENRAGWPGFSCVELDAVTSQRGATGAEGAIELLRRVHRSKDLARQELTDKRLFASGLPCIHLFHGSMANNCFH